ncbi:rRNA maturation RNase YbeY [Desulfoplanes formicivorans]|uniref:Endoribonuclease YbeY n=1 Tax=Desulfoplanes formicivorans TaxID=1592317 RepID=A0A194AE76_9BACT|nr:rRNA maturation RNase YbeY [Desulfoplanes formicivorans]GAU07426.1 16S rRNA maturation RNase YbeY [Desulfoplanes formicivorans]
MIHLETQARLNPTLPLCRSELLPLLTSILTCLGLQDRDLVLQCVDDRRIAALNKAFLGCTGPTNILSFPVSPEDSATVLGELALSIDTLTREIHLYGQDPREHLVRLLAHGILHLAGYDHGETMYSLTEMVVADVCNPAD